ncbi:MAG: hypothetical protein OXL98_01995, partial [Acidimicrobiaceae bacterium]|nr:hypothetical protein [Acidimicrobiaceae bacterium]
ADVMGEFADSEAEREQAKLERLAPALDAAMARKVSLPALDDDEIPVFEALGRSIVATLPPEEASSVAKTVKDWASTDMPIHVPDDFGAQGDAK